MTTMQIQRVGRARSPVRPGDVIKRTLMGQLPLETYSGKISTHEAAIVDLHNTYKEMIRQENQLREKKKKLRSMTYDSFCHLFKFARYLGLVEFVREEKMIFPPPTGNLYQIAKHNGVHMHVSKRRIFKITDLGIQDERAWADLCTAYKESWELPQRMEYFEPYPEAIKGIEVVEAVRKEELPKEHVKVEEELPGRPPVTVWQKRPSTDLYTMLTDRLRELQSIGIDLPDVKREVYGLSIVVGDWEVYVIEKKLATEKKLDVAKARMYRVEEDLLHRLFNALDHLKVDDAINIVGRLLAEYNKRG